MARTVNHPRNAGKAWGGYEDDTIRRMHAEGQEPPAIAEALGRTRFGVEMRLIKLGLVSDGKFTHAAGVQPSAPADPADAYWKGFADGEKHAKDVAACGVTDAPNEATEWARNFTPEEAHRGWAIRNGVKVYCCSGMFADVGHSIDCKHALGVRGTSEGKG